MAAQNKPHIPQPPWQVSDPVLVSRMGEKGCLQLLGWTLKRKRQVLPIDCNLDSMVEAGATTEDQRGESCSLFSVS